MAELYLICEGPADGLDNRVLDRMVAQRFARNILIQPACGDASLRSVAEHYLERSRLRLPDGSWGAPSDRVFTVEDRDYRTRRAADASWEPSSVHLIWRRHEIENYLLDPRVIAQAFQNLRSLMRRWHPGLPSSASDVDSLMQQLARPMAENFVGWVTYWRLVDHKRTLADTRFLYPDRRNPLRPVRYPGRQAWLDHLHRECARLRADCQEISTSDEFSDAYIDRLYDANLATTESQDFWATGRYVEDMGGHELLSAPLEHLSQSGIPISQSDLETELLQALDQIYTPGFYPVDDFAQLADRLA